MQGSIGNSINQWYLQNQRELPWRKNHDPYRIWLSEVMLQQTIVKVVIPYFENFLKHFPDVKALAAAKEEKVLSLWSGLGYYSRARNLHACAKQIIKLGRFPQSYSELLKLKGIGPYTAAAIASIAFNEEVPVVDGNVIRVISRIFDLKDDVQKRETQKMIFNLASSLIKNQTPRLHNQAMMELGALICTPKKPLCSMCPAQKFCLSFKNSTVDLRPVKLKKIKQEPWLWTIYVYKKGGRVALIKSGNGTPWLKNTWVFPGEAKKLTSKPKNKKYIRHSITKHQLFVKVVYKKTGLKESSNIRWLLPENIKDFGVSSIVQKILQERF